MPRLHRANTVAWGLLKWGMCAWMVRVHSVTRGWQDILFLLGCMGDMATHTTPEGRRVLPLCLEGRNIIDSKTYLRKKTPTPCVVVSVLLNEARCSAASRFFFVSRPTA